MAEALLVNRFQPAEFSRTWWFATAEAGTTIEQISKPEFWAHVASQMRPLDEIVVTTDDLGAGWHLLVADAWHNPVGSER
jgi:hypothetical protein